MLWSPGAQNNGLYPTMNLNPHLRAPYDQNAHLTNASRAKNTLIQTTSLHVFMHRGVLLHCKHAFTQTFVALW